MSDERGYLRVQGEFVEMCTETIHRRVRVEEWVTAIRAANTAEGTMLSTHALPIGTRWYGERNNQDRWWVIEEAPRKRTLQINGERHYLALPTVIWIIPQHGDNFYEPCIFFTPAWQKGETQLYAPLLANIGLPGGNVCLGRFNSPTTDPRHMRVEAMIAHFWGAGFNRDLNYQVVEAEEKGFRYPDWASAGSPAYLESYWQLQTTLAQALRQHTNTEVIL